ncbi:hypothetical protein Tco_1363404 [Tanacetum coccineum]
MSTSKTYQQSLADAGSETRPPMLERGPYQFEMFIPNNSTVLKLQTAEDLQGDALLQYDAEMELMNLILLSILNDIYNSVDACTSAKDMFAYRWQLDCYGVGRFTDGGCCFWSLGQNKRRVEVVIRGKGETGDLAKKSWVSTGYVGIRQGSSLRNSWANFAPFQDLEFPIEITFKEEEERVMNFFRIVRFGFESWKFFPIFGMKNDELKLYIEPGTISCGEGSIKIREKGQEEDLNPQELKKH